MTFPAEYQSAPFDFTEWQTTSLEQHVRDLNGRMDVTPIPRQRGELDREIGHAAFELVCRRQDYVKLYAELQATVALADVATNC